MLDELGYLVGVGVGGVLAGLTFGLLAARPRLAAFQRELTRTRRERDMALRQIDDFGHACGKAMDLATHGIEEPARDASRVLRGRSSAQGDLLRALDDLARLVSPRGGDGAVDLDSVSRRVSQTEEEHGTRLQALAGEAEGLTRTAESAQTTAGAMLSVMGEMEKNAEALTHASIQTADASTQMDDTLRRMQAGAQETQEVTTKVSTEAERGYRAVHKVLEEIERIRNLIETAHHRVDALGGRVVGIGDVIRVIQEIAEKTNLLALNASIIAAQAGEHGRSFAVVAQEIKALAQKTGQSTKQISEQIRGVQEESGRATDAMGTAVTAVAEGYNVTLAAGDALGVIRQSARVAQKRVQSMLRVMEEQGTASRRVVEAAILLAERATGLVNSVREQGGHRHRIAEAAADLAEGAGRILRLAREASESGRSLADGVGRLTGSSAQIAKNQRELRRNLERLTAGAHQLGGTEGDVMERLAALNEAAAQLREELARARA